MASFTNQATLTVRGVTASSNTVTGEIVGVLTAAKTSLEESYSLGSGITYILSIINSGDAALNSVTVTDDLGLGTGTNAPLSYVDGSAVWFLDGVRQAGITVGTGNGLVFSNLTVPANGNSIIIYDTVVNDYAASGVGSEITNTAVISGGTSPVEVTETVPVLEEPSLTISKALSPLTVHENGSVTYTFVIENVGNLPADVEDGVILSDTFNPVLTGLCAELNGTPLTLTEDYTYDQLTGEFNTVSGVITVPAASSSKGADGRTAIVPGRTVLTVSGSLGAQ